MKTSTLKDFKVPDHQLDEFVHECWESAGYFQRPEDAEQEVLKLEESLLMGERPESTTSSATDDEDLFE